MKPSRIAKDAPAQVEAVMVMRYLMTNPPRSNVTWLFLLALFRLIQGIPF
jgi:hypothetical protein